MPRRAKTTIYRNKTNGTLFVPLPRELQRPAGMGDPCQCDYCKALSGTGMADRTDKWDTLVIGPSTIHTCHAPELHFPDAFACPSHLEAVHVSELQVLSAEEYRALKQAYTTLHMM